MNTLGTTGQMPPPKLAARIASVAAALLFSALALAIPQQAQAEEAETEPGIVYVQHRFDSGSGMVETVQLRAYATYTEDKQAYTARINASDGAVEVDGRWTVQADGADITGECSYDEHSGLVQIPRKHLNTPVYITVDLNAEQSTKRFAANVGVVAGDEPGQCSSMSIDTSASALSIAIPVSGNVKAVTQDSHVLAPSEYEAGGGTLTVSGRSALTGSFTVYLDGYSPDVIDRNPIKDYNDTLIQRSLRSASPMSALARSDHGGWFDGWGWIWSTNQGPGEWDYTDYTMTWNGNTIYLNCCQHGVYHIPQSAGNGGSIYFTASRTSTSLVNQYDTVDATTVYHHKVYRNTYYVYVDAGIYQDVDGYWSDDYETVTTSPRYGGVELAKVSANPSVSNSSGSYSLAGATYGIFSDAAATYQLNSMTTNAGGNASLWGFVAGATVYVKETKASPGFNLDPTVYRVAITADQYAKVNGGTVREPPKTATVRFYADGDPTPIHSVTRPLGTSFASNDPELRIATGRAAKPNCTPGLDAWYRNSDYTSEFAGTILTGDVNLYARNIATVTYAPAAGSPLEDDLPFKKKMSEAEPTLNIAHNVMPPSRQVDWGRKIALRSPLLETLYYHDGERWRTVRWRGDGWYRNAAATGSAIQNLTVERDTVVYSDWSRSTYDGIYSW